MRNIITGIIVGLVVGIVLGVTILTPKIQRHAASGSVLSERDLEAGATETQLPLPVLNDGEVITFRTAPAYPTDRPNTTTMGQSFSRKLANLSSDKMLLPTPGPREIIERETLFTALAAGRIHALFATADIGLDKEPALSLFTGVPFGPDALDYMAWMQTGGGLEKLEGLFSNHNIRPLICGYLPPESGGWFKSRLRNREEINALKIRAHGFGALVWEKAGATVLRMNGEEIKSALDSGDLDAAVFSSPDVDSQLDFQNFADTYYYPSWQSNGQPLLLLINARNWSRLTQEHQLLLRTACAEHTSQALARMPNRLYGGLSEIGKKGILIEKMPGFLISELRTAWEDVLAHEVRQSPEFREGWNDLKKFLTTRETWKALNQQKDAALFEESQNF